jgi:DNA-binding CsgD family transcriptional regulator
VTQSTKVDSAGISPGSTFTRRGRTVLASADYKRAFDILERCDSAACLSDFKAQVIEALGSVMGFSHASFFAGPTFQSTFGDRTPIVEGYTLKMLPEYQDRWSKYDLFSSPTALRMLMSSGVTSLPELSAIGGLPATATAYVRHFLVNTWGLQTAACMRLDLHGNHTALIGIFDPDAKALGPSELATLRLLSRQLSAIARGIPFVAPRSAFNNLSPRQREVVRLVAEGLSNAQIASALSLAEDSVKKYVSRILTATECQTRMELAILARSDL